MTYYSMNEFAINAKGYQQALIDEFQKATESDESVYALNFRLYFY